MKSPIIAGLDIETTGFLEPDHRIVEIFIGLWQDRKLVWKYNQRIDPERSIPADATRVHGIVAADLYGMPKWDTVAPTVSGILERADIYAGHNALEFDMEFIRMELKRLGIVMPERPVMDTMLDGIWATSDGKKPRLEELCSACSEPYDHSLAHEAEYDVDRTMACLFKGIDYGFYKVPETPSQAAA